MHNQYSSFVDCVVCWLVAHESFNTRPDREREMRTGERGLRASDRASVGTRIRLRLRRSDEVDLATLATGRTNPNLARPCAEAINQAVLEPQDCGIAHDGSKQRIDDQLAVFVVGFNEEARRRASGDELHSGLAAKAPSDMTPNWSRGVEGVHGDEDAADASVHGLAVPGLADTEAVDMTVIGRTVNAASRLEAMTKERGCQIVMSRDVARYAGWDPPARWIPASVMPGFPPAPSPN